MFGWQTVHGTPCIGGKRRIRKIINPCSFDTLIAWGCSSSKRLYQVCMNIPAGSTKLRIHDVIWDHGFATCVSYQVWCYSLFYGKAQLFSGDEWIDGDLCWLTILRIVKPNTAKSFAKKLVTCWHKTDKKKAANSKKQQNTGTMKPWRAKVITTGLVNTCK